MKKNLVHVLYLDQATYSFIMTNDLSVEDNLERIFAEWNHGSGMECEMFINSKKRSLSVNDIVGINGKYYQCLPFGWKQVSDQYVYDLEEEVANHPRRIEGAWFALSEVMYSKRKNELEVA